MSTSRFYKKGDWKAVCDICGQVFFASQLKLNYDGLRVCHRDFEQRHPQELVRAKADNQLVPWIKREVSDVFIGGSGVSGIAGFAISGSMITGNTFNPGTIPEGTFTI